MLTNAKFKTYHSLNETVKVTDRQILYFLISRFLKRCFCEKISQEVNRRVSTFDHLLCSKLLANTYIYQCNISFIIEAFKDIWAGDRLLNVIEQFIGPEIAAHPLWNLRTKTPQNEATTVPWHQGSSTSIFVCALISIHFRSYLNDACMLVVDGRMTTNL